MKTTGFRALTSLVFGQLRAARPLSRKIRAKWGQSLLRCHRPRPKGRRLILGIRHPFFSFGCDLVNTLVLRSRLGGAPNFNGLARLRESRQVALHFFDGILLTIKPLFDRLKAAGV